MIEKIINGEAHTRDSIVETHKGLVHRECHKLKSYAKRVGQDYEDIVSIGFIGLLNAFDKFDGDKFDVRFSTYAVPMIWGEIQRALRDSGTGIRYSRNVKELGWKIRKNELEDKSVPEIAQFFETKEEHVVHALNFLKYGVPGSLDEPIKQSEGESSVADLIGRADDTTAILVEDFVSRLDERDKIVVQMLLDGSTQSAIGKELGVSQAQASRLVKKVGHEYLNYSHGTTKQRKNDWKKSDKSEEGGREVDRKQPEPTEEAVSSMKAQGMTYAAIAKEFGISAPTLATRRQNWELERVRAMHQEGKSPEGVRPPDDIKKGEVVDPSPAPSSATAHEAEIKELKEVVTRKENIIQDLQNAIDQLKAERDELAKQNTPVVRGQDDRKLLVILLERETARLKNLVEVG